MATLGYLSPNDRPRLLATFEDRGEHFELWLRVSKSDRQWWSLKLVAPDDYRCIGRAVNYSARHGLASYWLNWNPSRRDPLSRNYTVGRLQGERKSLYKAVRAFLLDVARDQRGLPVEMPAPKPELEDVSDLI